MKPTPFLALLATWATLAVPAASAQQIVIGGGYGAPAAAEIALANIAKSSEITVPATVDPVAVARERCGRATSTYVGLMKAANPGAALAPTDVARVFTFPACFIIRPDQKTATRLGSETLQDFALRVIGTGGPDTLKALQKRNGGAPLAATGQNATLAVPFSSAPVVYQLKPKAAANPAQAAASVVANFATTVVAEAVAQSAPGDLRPMSGIIARRAVSCDQTRPLAADADWPFNVAVVLKALDRNAAFRTARGLPPAKAVTVAVADNGVDGLFGANFPASILLINLGELPASGTTVFTNDPPTPVPAGGLADREHGTLMASLAVGGPDYRRTVTGPAASRVTLLPISMVQHRTVTGSNGNVTSYYGYPTQSLSEALRYAEARGADVLNLSIGTNLTLTDFETLALQFNPIVIAVAAGNEATEFRAVQLYPASYGGETGDLRGRVITVGASDRRGCLADFSGRGARTVDILAPGLGITAIGLGGVLETADGTSQATALVSFTVGLMKSEGMTDPNDIKDRLYASADRHPDLTPFVVSGGVLNIAKAISLHHDIWEKPGGDGTWGRLAKPPNLLDLCPELGDTANVKVLRIAWQGGDTPLLVMWRAVGGARTELSCKPVATLDPFDFTSEDGVQTQIKVDQIGSLVLH